MCCDRLERYLPVMKHFTLSCGFVRCLGSLDARVVQEREKVGEVAPGQVEREILIEGVERRHAAIVGKMNGGLATAVIGADPGAVPRVKLIVEYAPLDYDRHARWRIGALANPGLPVAQ